MVVPSHKEWAANAWGLNNLRGGEAAAAAASSMASSTSTNSPNTLQCVMQIPRPATSATNQHDNSNKGQSKPKTTKTTPLRVTALSKASTKKKKPTPASSSSPSPVEYVAETKLPTDIGQFQLRAYRVPGAPIGQEPCVIYSRDRPPFGQHNVPVRIHDQCLTSEVFRSQRCVKM
jgi:GTP cyclohydrolase II